MLLFKLTNDQRSAFMAIIQNLSRLDQRITPVESHIIDELREELGISDDDIPDNIDVRKLPSIFPKGDGRAILMIELARLAVSDTIVCIEEKNVLSNIGKTLGYTSTDIENILSLANVYRLLMQGIRKLTY